MMKKEYISPECNVVIINMNNTLLVVRFGAGNADESENLSRESSFWDEEEDY